MTEDFRGSRCQLLTDLNFALDEEEVTAETLLKAFDLSLHDCDILLSKSPESNEVEDSYTDLPPSRPQNPFLSTPLRLKHFSRLSPSILRGLLRSPSLRSPSLCDDSLDNGSNIYSTPELDELQSTLESPALRWRPTTSSRPSAELTMQSHQYSLPLTPPPTGRIPLLAQLPDPVISSHDLPSVPQTTGFFPPIQTNSLVSPAAVRNFQRVIDEMKGVDPGHQANDLTYDFVSSLPSYLSTPVKEFVIPEDTRDGGSPPSNAPLAMDRTLGTLEDEFVALLQQRAIEEEADAKELRVLASRLERVGNGRRHLAALIQERKIGQSEARMQVR